MTASPSTTKPAATLDRQQCAEWLRQLLSRDGWTLRAPAAGDPQPVKEAAFVAARHNRRIAFFFADQPTRRLQAAFRDIARLDRNAYQLLGVLIVPTRTDLSRARAIRQAKYFPRAFFAIPDDLRDAANGTLSPVPAPPNNVESFTADLLANDQVGGPDSPYYILRFHAPAIEDVTPSQFVMMDVAPVRPLLSGRVVRRRGRSPQALSSDSKGWGEDLDRPPLPILKRPFGIQRAYYHHFDKLYLQRLVLPPALAPALYTVYPHQFDLLYKVLPDGVGTAWMTKLKRGDQVHMVGPLGRPYDVRSLRARGVEEVHVIGGGVGMAPLILLVQVLRYYSFPVKVFIGISKLDILRYHGDVDATFAEEPGNAYVYVDDLLDAGLAPADIHLAFDTEAPARAVRGIPQANLFAGFVTNQYRAFLAQRTETVGHASPTRSAVQAFTCGPDKMMELIWEIAQGAGIPLNVLMEKRMGCGFGVCLSCVCKVRRADGSEDYARVCTEGPVFDAGDIIWKNNH